MFQLVSRNLPQVRFQPLHHGIGDHRLLTSQKVLSMEGLTKPPAILIVLIFFVFGGGSVLFIFLFGGGSVLQGSYGHHVSCSPKQCSVIREIPQNYHRFALFV